MASSSSQLAIKLAERINPASGLDKHKPEKPTTLTPISDSSHAGETKRMASYQYSTGRECVAFDRNTIFLILMFLDHQWIAKYSVLNRTWNKTADSSALWVRFLPSTASYTQQRLMTNPCRFLVQLEKQNIQAIRSKLIDQYTRNLREIERREGSNISGISEDVPRTITQFIEAARSDNYVRALYKRLIPFPEINYVALGIEAAFESGVLLQLLEEGAISSMLYRRCICESPVLLKPLFAHYELAKYIFTFSRSDDITTKVMHLYLNLPDYIFKNIEDVTLSDFKEILDNIDLSRIEKPNQVKNFIPDHLKKLDNKEKCLIC